MIFFQKLFLFLCLFVLIFFSEGKAFSNSGIIEEIGTRTIENEENNGDKKKKKTEQENSNLENFEIRNNFQRPTYLLEKEIDKEEYFCNSENEECKVNFDFRNSFSKDFLEKDFICELNYLEEKIENCNPKTIIFKEKETEVKIKISSKKDENIFKEKIIKVNKVKKNIDAPEKVKIIVQSGLVNKNCNDEKCKVNFNFKSKNKKIKCRWKFSNVTVYKDFNDEKCNPSSVNFPPGEHLISLRVYNKKTGEFIGDDYFEFKNIFIPEELNAKIILQGISKKYQIFDNIAICDRSDSCKINFGLENISKSVKKYLWNFGNGEIYEGKNPKSILFKE